VLLIRLHLVEGDFRLFYNKNSAGVTLIPASFDGDTHRRLRRRDMFGAAQNMRLFTLAEQETVAGEEIECFLPSSPLPHLSLFLFSEYASPDSFFLLFLPPCQLTMRLVCQSPAAQDQHFMKPRELRSTRWNTATCQGKPQSAMFATPTVTSVLLPPQLHPT
jgi:hypothetical protein